MFATKLQHRRLQSIVITLIIAIVAIAGLLLLMGQLAAPETPVVEQNDTAQRSPPPNETASPIENDSDDVIATVNDQIITKKAWQKATRLDAVMNQLAHQPIATAEETLDRLISEIIVLEAVSASVSENNEVEPAIVEEIEARTLALEQNWNVTDEAVVAALAEAGLTRDDLLERVGRLIQVETALNQLATQEDDLNAWLAEARATAEIGLYHALVSSPPPQAEETTQETSIAEASTQNEPAPVEIESFAPPPEMPVAPYVENAAPDFSLPQLNGEPLTLSDFRGKPVLINFWASWCPPCRRELPALQAAYTAYGDKIGFIAVDVKEDPHTVASFVEELGLSFPVVLDQDGRVSDVSYEVRGIPTTIFVDAYGVVAGRHVGPLDEATIDSYLTPLIEQVEQIASSSDQTAPAESNEPVSAVTLMTNDETAPTQTTGDQEAGNVQQEASPFTTDSTAAPDFTLASAGGASISLQDYRGENNVVLVFYRGHT